MVSLAKFVRSTPQEALREYLQRIGITVTSAIQRSTRTSGTQQSVMEAINRSDEANRVRVFREAERISAMADDSGQTAIYSIVDDHLSLETMENGHARAMHVFLNDTDAFRRAEEIRYTDEHRRGRKWEGYEAAPRLIVRRDAEVVERFKEAVRKRFDTKNVHVDIFDRTRPAFDGKAYELIQATVYRDGRLDDVLEFINGKLDRCSRRPVIEAALTYEPATGTIEVVADVREIRDAFVLFFLKVLLGVQAGQSRLPLRRYDLGILMRRYDFPTDPEDGIEAVRVNLLRLMPLGTAGERVTLECLRDASTPIWQMAAAHFGSNNPLLGGWVITQAKIVIKFRPTRENTRGRTLPLTITMPHGCDLKDRTERERIVGDKYLRRWGLLEDA
jgi:hypothetical protein